MGFVKKELGEREIKNLVKVLARSERYGVKDEVFSITWSSGEEIEKGEAYFLKEVAVIRAELLVSHADELMTLTTKYLKLQTSSP